MRRYIDFVPTKKSQGVRKSQPSVERKVSAVSVARKTSVGSVHKTTRISNTASSTANFGVLEDLSPKVTTTPRVATVSRVTPVSRATTAHFVTEQSSVRAAKAQKVGIKTSEKPVEKSVEKPAEKAKDAGTYKTPFINQDKVKKRPLSKNVYRKRPSVTKTEEKQGPVTIIAKPEKDAKIGLIVTIIITIILGAAAGTVAFLLLPK